MSPMRSAISRGSSETMKRDEARSRLASARRSISIGSSTPAFSSPDSASAAHQPQSRSARSRSSS